MINHNECVVWFITSIGRMKSVGEYIFTLWQATKNRRREWICVAIGIHVQKTRKMHTHTYTHTLTHRERDTQTHTHNYIFVLIHKLQIDIRIRKCMAYNHSRCTLWSNRNTYTRISLYWNITYTHMLYWYIRHAFKISTNIKRTKKKQKSHTHEVAEKRQSRFISKPWKWDGSMVKLWVTDTCKLTYMTHINTYASIHSLSEHTAANIYSFQPQYHIYKHIQTLFNIHTVRLYCLNISDGSVTYFKHWPHIKQNG